ncbi:phage tail tape measure protein [Siccibacter turicensis]|uniref:phage tail tape measure protein n=1 Tax=Siccibacter turicensis TaxID=357233 RepID=UPI0023F22B97|nr:phage tail tape measure protein [Siccibacter turicensis]
MADSFQLKAIITAVDQLSGPLKGMGRNLKGFQKEASGIMMNAAAMGAALTSAFVVPINQAIQFESTMADVRKVVDFDTPSQFREMGEDILKLSTVLPMTADGIGQIVAAGGQAGIARNELKQFATDAVKMGIAFDQTAEESGDMMAKWRTAFKLTQKDVVTLADKINYLGNTGPANARQISDIVTTVGSLAAVNHVSTGNLAALGATISGMGVQSEVASTGIQNFMLALSNASTGNAKRVLKAIGMSPKELSAGMVKDSKATMLKVLEGIKSLPEASRSKALEWLFGRESIKAIAPLLNNLDLLRANFGKVADAQQYSSSMQKEYESRAATTANSIQLMKNQFTAASITIGEMFLPSIVKITAKIQPMAERLRQFAKNNPELIRSTFKFGATLLGTGAAMGVVGKAFKTFDSIMKMSTLGKLVSLLIIAGGLIVSNWDQIGPIVKEVWDKIDGAAKAVGGWQTVLTGLAAFMAGKWALSMISSISGVTKEMLKLGKSIPAGGKGMIGKLGLIGSIATISEPLVDKGLNAAFGDNKWFQNVRTARGWGEFGRSILGENHLGRDDKGNWRFEDVNPKTLDSVATAKPQQGELKVSFENAPPGMRVAQVGNTLPWYQFDVGYNRFSQQK